MRIHADTLTYADLHTAAQRAQVELRVTRHGSRKRDHAFEVTLRGMSKRRPNFYDGDGSYAATWDQWGVFLASLFEADYSITCAYVDAAQFDYRTNGRFDLDFSEPIPFPLDHDHVFRFAGIPYSQTCTRCGAVTRWNF